MGGRFSRFADLGPGWVGVGALLLVGVLSIHSRIPQEEGSAEAWVLARSVTAGEGYRDLSHPEAPTSGRSFLLYPLALTPVVGLGFAPGAGRALSLIFALGALALFWAFSRRRLGIDPGSGVALAVGLNPALGAVALALRPEAMLAFWFAVSLYASARWEERPLWFAIALAGGVLAFLTAPLGMAALPAMTVALTLRRRWHRFAWTASVTLVLAVGMAVWSCALAEETRSCFSWLYVGPGHSNWGLLSPAELVQRIARNVSHYAVDVLPATLVGPTDGAGKILALPVAVAFALLAVVGWARSIQAARVLELLLAAAALLALAAPTPSASAHLWAPVVPVAIVCVMQGSRGLLTFLPGALSRRAGLLVGTGLAVVALPHAAKVVANHQTCSRAVERSDRQACRDDDWRGFFDVALWVRDQVPDGAVVVTAHPKLFFWASGRSSVNLDDPAARRDFWAFVDSNGASHILLDPVNRQAQWIVLTAIRADPTRVEVAHRAGNPPTTLLRVRERSAGRPGRGRR